MAGWQATDIRLGEPFPWDQAQPGEHGYPRPMLRRAEWTSLNGAWEFALDPLARWRSPPEVAWSGMIQVPFAPETERSGVHNTSFYRACWYRRATTVPPPGPQDRLLLHFGAVDYIATVWVNGARVATHEGGYTPFSADITEQVRSDGHVEVVVRAEDDPADLSKPRGKQDWQLQPHSIWYPRTTGIWQTVWLERVPSTRIESLRWSADLTRWEIGISARITGSPERLLRLAVELTANGQVLAHDTYTVSAGDVNRRISLSDPGIDDSRNELLWSPARPVIIEARLELWEERGQRLDAAWSYTALRAIGIQGDRLVLNGRPYLLRMVLDQGYWPESGISAPDDAALRRDVEIAKAMGFNGVRKHQKIEDPRYLYWADRLGLLVWEEMPSAYRFTEESVQRLTTQWIEAIARDRSHPCVMAWVPFNESWGVPNLPDSRPERHCVQALYHLTHTLDPSRPVVGNDGWESVTTDLIGIHDYDDNLERIRARYRAHDVLPRLFRHERPGGRVLMLEDQHHAEHPIILSEFGGISLQDRSKQTWGYSECRSTEDLAQRYTKLLATVRSSELLSGFCYTQFADTFQEANGLLYADRTPKFPLERIAQATRGGHTVTLPTAATDASSAQAGQGPGYERERE